MIVTTAMTADADDNADQRQRCVVCLTQAGRRHQTGFQARRI
jgi:hypothetical protein